MTLKDLAQKSIAEHKTDIENGIAQAIAKSPSTTAPKKVFKGSNSDAENRIAEIAFIAKSIKGESLSKKDLSFLDAKAKAVGVTTDVTELLPDGFTGTLIRDIQEHLRIARLFPMGQINGGTAHDIIALNGIEAFVTNEATDGTDSAEDYTTFVKTTKKIMAVVRKSYEVLSDSLIDLAAEVRLGLIDALARGVEKAVINGDISNTMDAGLAAGSPQTV